MEDDVKIFEINDLVKILTPLLVQEIRGQAVCWGDPARLHIDLDAVPGNALLNVASGEIYIGKNTFFGHNVCILTGSHDASQRGLARRAHPKSGNDIHIGAGVWVASNATVLGPCRIGDDAVIAAGAVLLPGEYAGGKVYAGVPARPVKDIDFADDPAPPDNPPADG